MIHLSSRRLAALIVLLGLGGVLVQAQDLPRQTGAINDYAAALGGKPQRASLQALVGRLRAEQGVELVILLSERDPFDDPERYGVEIQRAWHLPAARGAFALFLKRPEGWLFRLWLSPDLSAALDERGVATLREQVNKLTRSRRLREATLTTAQGLLKLAGRQDSPLLDENRERTGVLLYGMLVLALVVGWMAWRRWAGGCPRCGRRLRRAGRGAKGLKRCPHCGYNR